MSQHQQIDPRLYGNAAQSVPHQQHFDQSARLPRIDQTHQLPPLSSTSQLGQPYYRLPSAQSTQVSPSMPLQPPPPPVDDDDEEHYDGPQEQYGQYSRENSPVAKPNADPNDPKRPRACEACRGLKVRCDRDETQPNKPCKRCWKAKRNCIVTAPSRKRQKKTDSRVAELEKKIDALTKSLHAQNVDGQLSPPQSNYSTSTAAAHTPPNGMGNGNGWQRNLEDRSAPGFRHSPEPSTDRVKRRLIEKSKDLESQPPQRPRSSRTDDSDSVSSGLLSVDMNSIDALVDQDTATRVFNRYITEMARHLPAVTFDSNITASEIRATRPVLFLAILDAASVGMLPLDLQQRLNKMLLDVFASSIIRQGEKSLDLIQALMVSTIWYRPPARYEAMNVYLLTHLSALMALEFGMGKKLNVSQSWRIAARVGQAQRPQTFLNSDSVEARRTWLGCYFQCMTVSLSMRRPNFIRWNSHVEECVKLLESAPEALPSDQRLCQIIKLMHINEEVGQRFSMDDPSATIVITDPRVQFAIRGFEERLDEWCASIPRDMWDPLLIFSSHFCRLYIHEVALHNNHNVDDFRAPFTEESLKTPSLQARHLSPYHSGLLKQCLTSVHGMIDTFISFDKVTVKAMPIFYFVRIAYAVVVLIKLYYAISVPNSNLYLKETDLQVEHYLDNLCRVFETIAQEEAFRPAKKFMLIVFKLRDGFHKDKGLKRPSPVLSSSTREEPSMRKVPGGQQEIEQQAPPPPPPPAQLQPQPQRSDSRLYASPVANVVQYADAMAIPKYDSTQSPLHFLSEVATNNSVRHDMTQSMQQQYDVQAHAATNWYQGGIPQQPVMIAGADYSSSMDPGFEQAVDLTMGIGEGDLSSLFMEDSTHMYAYGAPGLGAENVAAMGLYGSEAGW